MRVVPVRNQMGQTSLFWSSGVNVRTLGCPRGRIVDSRSNLRTMDSTQPSSPSGAPRWAQLRTALSSLSLSGSLTRWTQFGRRAIGTVVPSYRRVSF